MMDFVDWCDSVLRVLVEQTGLSTRDRIAGMHSRTLTLKLSSDANVSGEDVHTALCELRENGLVEDRHVHYWSATARGRELAADAFPLWQAICAQNLEPEHQAVVGLVNARSVTQNGDSVGLFWVEGDVITSELDWPDPKLLHAIARELEQMGFVNVSGGTGGLPKLHAKYKSVVWETRQGITIESAFIDALVDEWETTSVDFKRQLETRTKDQKAELVKDLLGLANTQASGRRWMIIGFEDKTHAYWGAPSAKLKQEHLEQILSQYTDPVIQIRYEVVAYRLGPVGMIEVLREPSKLPYRVARSVGANKQIRQNQTFVRHGSLTEEPTEREFAAIVAEAERAIGT